ncbi:MAG TPA: DUF58 domain-containing protein, partial [Chthoniobacterales bacterium]|nr:DUF58 domain-containing protein [Chthoniobacterales bacterium]
MIAPRTNLVVWAAAIILPLSILAGVVGSLRSICVLGIVVFALASLVDLLLGLGKYRQLEFQIPAVNRVTARRDFELDLKLNGTGLRSGAIRLVLDLPSTVKSDHSHIALRIQAGILNLSIPVKAVAEHRGTYPIDRLFFDWISPVRLWVFREERPLRSELRVYPDLALEGRKIAHFLDRGGFGVHRQRQIGRGREFEKLREYEPGDSFDSIHWKAAAKRYKPITKVFQVEKSQEVYLAIDSSRLSSRALGTPEAPGTTNHESPSTSHISPFTSHRSPSSTVLESFIAATLLAGATAERQGDL